MTSSRIALAVFLGSVIGLLIVYPYLAAWRGVLVFAAFNGAYAWLVCRVASMALDFFFLAKRRP